MWGYPEFYIPVPGGWNQSLQHLQHAGMAAETAQLEAGPADDLPEPEAEAEAEAA
jgi:hypothetical protein